MDGLDSNRGTSALAPFQTLAEMEAAIDAAPTKTRTSPKRASHWREAYPSAASVVVEHGTGALAMVDGSDPITGWEAEGTANVWQKTGVVHDATGTNRLRVYDLDGNLLARVANVATCSSTAGSFVDVKGSDGSPVTIKVHPSTGDLDPEGYEVTTRLVAAQFGDSARVEGLRVQRAISNNGALEVGENASVKRVLSVDGSKHNFLIRSGLMEDCIALRCDPPTSYELSNTRFVLFTPDAAGKSGIFRRCFTTGAVDAQASAITVHDSAGNWYDSVTGEQLASIGIIFGWGISALVVEVNGYFSKDQLSALSGYSDDHTWRYVQVQAGSNDIGLGLAPGDNPASAVMRILDGAFYDAGSNSGLFRLTAGLNGVTIEIERNAFYSAGNRPRMTAEGMSSGTIKVNRSIFASVSGDYPITIPTGVTYEGNYNVFAPFTRCKYHGTDYLTLASWQAATGQDLNSIDVTLAGLLSGTVANGDFRLAGTGSGAAAAGLFAGPQNHWDWNARAVAAGPPEAWPDVPETIAESETYVSDPEAWDFYP